MNPKENSIETDMTYNWMENGILYCLGKDNAYITLEEAKKITAAFQALTDKPLPVLVYVANSIGNSSDARKYLTRDLNHLKSVLAVALVVSNFVGRIIANFFIRLSNAPVPMQLFNDEDSALEWLEQFKSGK